MTKTTTRVYAINYYETTTRTRHDEQFRRLLYYRFPPPNTGRRISRASGADGFSPSAA